MERQAETGSLPFWMEERERCEATGGSSQLSDLLGFLPQYLTPSLIELIRFVLQLRSFYLLIFSIQFFIVFQ